MADPIPQYSSIKVEKNYLVKYIGKIILVTVVLNNRASDLPVAIYRVSMKSKLE